MESKKYPRILVVTINSFSKSNSNGRTLGSMFEGWPIENLAQICVSENDPDWNLCNKYYCINDRAVIEAFKHRRKAVGRILCSDLMNNSFEQNGDTEHRKKIGEKTISKMLIREILWSCKRWQSKSLKNWVEEYNPQVILYMMGDSIFMPEIALSISKQYKIPLVLFNTEAYYFFKKNCYKKEWTDYFLYPIYKLLYKKKIRKLLQSTSKSIHCNSLLKQDYDKEFGGDSSVIYTGSTIEFAPKNMDPNDVRFSYLGNLGLDRDSALVEIGELLHSIDKRYKIDVYGRASQTVASRLRKSIGVEYKGLIDYEGVKRIIAESDILFHVETEVGLREKLLKYGFSTKIADSIASGKSFVLYAPYDMASTKYILDTGAGWYASNINELRNVITSIICNNDLRWQVLNKAKEVSETNHNIRKNAEIFRRVLISSCDSNKK